MKRTILLCAGLLVTSCGGTSTSIELVVEAEVNVALRSTIFLVETRDQEGQVVRQEFVENRGTVFPLRRLFVPRGGDASRTVSFLVQAFQSRESTTPLTTVRARRSFVENRRTEVRMVLYDVCLGTNCPEGLTCEPQQGRPVCVDSNQDPPPILDAGVDQDSSTGCVLPLRACGPAGLCTATLDDEANCGECERVCDTDQVCNQGACDDLPQCTQPSDCTQTGTYCDIGTSQCANGCDAPSDCGTNAVCDEQMHRCGCAAGHHACGTECVADSAVTSCGESCSPCAGGQNAQPSCVEGVCGISCNSGFHPCSGECRLDTSTDSCGSSCEPCPVPSRGTALCVSGQCGIQCDEGLTQCGASCVDLSLDAAHCNACDRACPSLQICRDSACIDPPNCNPAVPTSCEGLTYCDATMMRCQPGCDRDAQCGSNQVCNTGNHTCVCSSGYHSCGGNCVLNASTANCGTSCQPCVPPANATSTCDGSSCGFACSMGYHQCGNLCASDSSVNSCGSLCSPCPTDPNGTAGCTGSSCTLACNSGYRSCSGACRACPSGAGIGTTRCSGSTCVIDTCTMGYRLCGGVCTACPTSGVAGTTCNADRCVASSCSQGFTPCAGGCCGMPPPTHVWSRRWGTEEFQWASSAQLTSDGGIVIGGVLNGTIDFGGGNVMESSSGGFRNDSFVASYGPTGTFRWVTIFPGTGSNGVEAMAIDSSGHIVVAGDFTGQLTVGPNTFSGVGPRDTYLARLTPEGAVVWSLELGDHEDQPFPILTVNAAGDITLAARLIGSVTVGNVTLESDPDGDPFNGGYDFFVARFNSSGVAQWAKLFTGAETQYVSDIAEGPSNSVYIVGGFESSMKFDGTSGPITLETDDVDGYLIRLSGTDGNALWARQYGGAEVQSVYRVAAAQNGDPIAWSQLDGTSNYGGGNLTSRGETDVILFRLTSTGAFVWARQFGDETDQSVWPSIFPQPDDSVVLVGHFEGRLDLGASLLPSQGDDLFMVQFDPSGQLEWQQHYRSLEDQRADGADAVDVSATRIAFGGSLYGSANLGGTNLVSAGEADAFAAVYTRP